MQQLARFQEVVQLPEIAHTQVIDAAKDVLGTELGRIVAAHRAE